MPSDEIQQLLEANESFYKAFRECDSALMDAIWSRDEPVFCIHPGWLPLVGRRQVIENWEGIMSQPGSPDIHCEGASARIDDDHGTVVCFENVGDSRLVATNLFIRSPEGGWRIYHHHAGPTEPKPSQVH